MGSQWLWSFKGVVFQKEWYLSGTVSQPLNLSNAVSSYLCLQEERKLSSMDFSWSPMATTHLMTKKIMFHNQRAAQW